VLRDAWRIERSLPKWFAAEPLPQLMQHLDDEARARGPLLARDSLTRLADAAVGLDYTSPLGICLRRSLVRYVLLRRAGVGVSVHFGGRKEAGGARSRIAGHAWLTLDGRPYAEEPENYQGFAVIYSYPVVENTSISTSRTVILSAAKNL
jgi:Transglutaminase-like superfamily